MKEPKHPGQYIKELLKERGYTMGELAHAMYPHKSNSVATSMISRVIKYGRISEAMCVRLAHVLGGTPVAWAYIVADYRVPNAQKKLGILPGKPGALSCAKKV